MSALSSQPSPTLSRDDQHLYWQNFRNKFSQPANGGPYDTWAMSRYAWALAQQGAQRHRAAMGTHDTLLLQQSLTQHQQLDDNMAFQQLVFEAEVVLQLVQKTPRKIEVEDEEAPNFFALPSLSVSQSFTDYLLTPARPFVPSDLLEPPQQQVIDLSEDDGETVEQQLQKAVGAETYKSTVAAPAPATRSSVPASQASSQRPKVTGAKRLHAELDDEEEQPTNDFRTASSFLNVRSERKLGGGGAGSGNPTTSSKAVYNKSDPMPTFMRTAVAHGINGPGGDDDDDSPQQEESKSSVKARPKFVPPLKKQDQPASQGKKTSSSENGAPAKKKAKKEGAGGGTGEDHSDPGRHFEDGVIPEELANLDPQLVDSIMNEILEKKSNITFDDIAGLEFAKKQIGEMVLWPMQRPDLFRGLRDPAKGILFFGPPGTGKTLIAKAIANQCNSRFFNISASSLMSKWVGEGERLVKTLFAVARYFKRSVIFVDEIDSMLSKRGDGDQDSSMRRMKTEFLVQIDGAGTTGTEQVLFIGATNRPQEIDEAVRRRLAKKLYIPLPTREARLAMVVRLLNKPANTADGSNEPALHYELSPEDLESIITSTDGYSGSDMTHLCKEAALNPMRELIHGGRGLSELQQIQASDIRPVQLCDFQAALKVIRPSVTQADIDSYIEWDKEHGSMGQGRY